jgi:hypothetical protein
MFERLRILLQNLFYLYGYRQQKRYHILSYLRDMINKSNYITR